MTEPQRMIDLAQAIAEAFVQNVSYSQPVIDQVNIQQQIMSVKCGNSGNNCYECLKQYDPKIDVPNYYCPKGNCEGNSVIKSLQQNQCSFVCQCSFNAFQTSTVNVPKNTKISVTETDIEKMIADSRKNIAIKYPNFQPSQLVIRGIIEKSSQTFIAQMVSSTQAIILSGIGEFDNINLRSSINGIMNAIGQNSTVELRESVTSYVTIIKNEVQAKVKRTIGQVLMSFLTAWIILGAVILAVLILNSILWIRKLGKKT